MMYFNFVPGIPSIFPIIIFAAFSLASEPILPSDDLFTTDTLSPPIDQLSDISLNPLFEPMDFSSSPSSLNALDTSSDLFVNSATPDPSNDLFWDDADDPLLLAGCSASDLLPPARRGRLRARQRSDGALECANPAMTSRDSSGGSDANAKVPPIMLPQVYEKDKHSVQCWEITLGILPFAVASSGEEGDVVLDPTRTEGFTVTWANIPYSPRTVYRGTVSKFPPFISFFFLTQKSHPIPSHPIPSISSFSLVSMRFSRFDQ